MPTLLSVLAVNADGDRKHRRAVYRCECGSDFVAFVANVNGGTTRSCGCVRRRVTGDRARIHGHRTARTRTYVAWVNMKARCDNQNAREYANYGGRGIAYDPRWSDFTAFLADMGEAPAGLTLDRRDNEQGYAKDNCRWVSRAVQGLNKRNCVRYTLNGKSQTLAEWARETGIGRVTMLKRIQRGVPLGLALSVKGYLKG